jgi:hypothetical protein
MTEPTAATFRAYDPLSGGVAAPPEEADELRLENAVLRDRVRVLETLLAVARAERDTARATGTVGVR